jgi:ABC-type anion transport system duplicated permease subunit
METIVTFHARFTNTVWLFLLILGLWSLLRAIRGQSVTGNFLGALVIAEILIVIQVVLGAFLYLGGRAANLNLPAIHILYAAFSVVFLPFVFLYWLRGDVSNRGQWVLTFAILFQFGTIFYRFGPYAPV